MPDLETRTVLVLSTAHLRPETAEMLKRTDPSDLPFEGGPYGSYGWFCYAHDEDNGGEVPSEMMAAFDYARARNCSHVLFDMDEPEIEDLPVFNWAVGTNYNLTLKAAIESGKPFAHDDMIGAWLWVEDRLVHRDNPKDFEDMDFIMRECFPPTTDVMWMDASDLTREDWFIVTD